VMLEVPGIRSFETLRDGDVGNPRPECPTTGRIPRLETMESGARGIPAPSLFRVQDASSRRREIAYFIERRLRRAARGVAWPFVMKKKDTQSASRRRRTLYRPAAGCKRNRLSYCG